MASSSNMATSRCNGLPGLDVPRCLRPGRQLCIRPNATASPDVKADDTAEARRRLARQFRKHKLEPQPVSGAPSSRANTYYSSQLVRPRGRTQQPHQRAPSAQHEQHAQLHTGGAYIGHLHPADAAAAAAARELLEWQFQLEPEIGPGSSTGLSTEAAADAWAQDPAGGADADLLQLPSTLLPGISTAEAGTDAGKQLTKAITGASHWRQVQSLVQEHAPELVNIRHLCAALTRMVYLQPTFHSSSSGTSSGDQDGPQQQQVPTKARAFLQQLYSSIHGAQDSLSYRQACNVLWAAGKLKHSALPSTDCLTSLYQHARQVCSTEQRDLEQQHQAAEEGSAQAAQAREEHLQWRAAAFSHAGQLAGSLVSLQQVLPAQQLQDMTAWVLDTTKSVLQDHIQQHQPVPGQRASSKIMQPQQQQQAKPCQRPLPGRDVANLAASLATLGAQPSPAWLSAFAAALGCKGLIYIRSYRDVSQLLWATAMFSKEAAEGSAAANSLQAAAAALMVTAPALSLHSCDGQALTNTLWALATLGQRPPVAWLDRVLQHAQAAAARGFLSAQGVSVTLWALAALAVVPQASCLSALLSAAQQHMRHMTPQGCSNVLWALAVLERPPSKEWLSGFWVASRTLLPQMTSQGLVNCLWAAARLKVQPLQEWVGDVAGLLLQRGVSSLTRQGLGNTTWALSRISITCRTAHELLQSCLEEAALVLQQQHMQQLQQQQQQQQEAEQQQQELQQAAATQDSSSSGSTDGGFNIYELSGLLHAVCCLRQREQQQQQHHTEAAAMPASSSSSSFDSAAAVEGADLLGQLTVLLQEVSTPLLPTAGATELSIMLWSQVAMPVGHLSSSSSSSGAALQGSLQQQQQGAGALAPDSSTPSSSPSTTSSSRPSQLVIPRKWMLAWFAATKSAFSAASSRDLATWVWGLAKKGGVFRPQQQWMAGWQVASFRQLGRASSQDLSNMLWSLASLGITPEPAWLQQYMLDSHSRQRQKQVAPQHYGNIGWALAKLGHRPERFWADRYTEDVFRLLPRFKPQELTNVLRAMAVLNMKVPEELLVEVRDHMSAMLPAYKVNEVAVSMWALARLKAQPRLRLMAAALQHCFSQARLLTPTGLTMLMWSVGNMDKAPPKAWVAKLLVATQVRMAGFSAQELSNLAVSLARLEYRPPDSWLDTFAAATAARMHSFEAQALANTLWALATLHYTPSEAWMNAFDAQLARHVNSCTPAHVAMTLWALSQLQWLPAEPLLQQLRERAEIHSGDYILSSRRMLARAMRVLKKVESEDEEEEQQQQQPPQRQQQQRP